MTIRRSTLILMVLVATTVAAHSTVSAQTSWTPPRTPDGQADLQGVWANNSATPLERPEQLGDKAELTAEELAELEATIAAFRDAEQAGDLLGDRLVQQALGNEDFQDFDVVTGNYNAFWLVERSLDNRTSLVVDPPNGRISPVTPEARRRAEQRQAYSRAHPSDGPEDRGYGDRCLHFGLPKIGSGYNSYHQLLQTPDHVVIYSEMAHDARIIPIDDRPLLDTRLRQWNGDARARWEGDTLVVETRNFSPKYAFRGSTEDLHLEERFTRLGPDTLEQVVTVNDPRTWSQPWTVRILLTRTEDAIFEYACHEGNYALPGILGGARAEERAGGSR